MIDSQEKKFILIIDMDRKTYLNNLHRDKTNQCIKTLLYFKTYCDTIIPLFPFEIIQYIFCFVKQEILKSYIYNIVEDVSMHNSEYEIEGFPFPHTTLYCSIGSELMFSTKDDISYMFFEIIEITLIRMNHYREYHENNMNICCELYPINEGWNGLVCLQRLLIHLSSNLDENSIKILKKKLTINKRD